MRAEGGSNYLELFKTLLLGTHTHTHTHTHTYTQKCTYYMHVLYAFKYTIRQADTLLIYWVLHLMKDCRGDWWAWSSTLCFLSGILYTVLRQTFHPPTLSKVIILDVPLNSYLGFSHEDKITTQITTPCYTGLGVSLWGEMRSEPPHLIMMTLIIFQIHSIPFILQINIIITVL